MPGSLSNIQGTGSIGGNASLSNISSSNKSTTNKDNQVAFTGNPIGNAFDNLQAIGAGIYSLIGGVIGFDKESRAALGQFLNNAASNPSQAGVGIINALLSTYNLAMDDLGNMPIGEVVGHVMTGAWQHPIDAALDITAIGGVGKSIVKSLTKGAAKATAKEAATKIDDIFKGSKLNDISDMDVRLRLAEEVTKDNLRLNETGSQFYKQVADIEKKYSPENIAKAMQAIETVGFRQAPEALKPIMQELTKANDTYKQFVSMAGAELIDDAEFATRELIAKEYSVPFETVSKLSKDTKLFQDTYEYVIKNEVKPLFHLKPQVAEVAGITEGIQSSLLKRAFGGLHNYDDAARNLTGKAEEFINKVNEGKVANSATDLNKKIKEFNKETGRTVKELEIDNPQFTRVLQELNTEFKKTMLSSGIYLGANVMTTTLSILNNFSMKALIKTFKNLPKFRMVELAEAQTPILHTISKINNFTYRPIASFDKYLENIAKEYIKHYGIDKAKFLQSTIPSMVVPTAAWEKAARQFVPFANYPIAAMREVAAHVKEKPLKVGIYNQLNKIGQELNEQAQQQIGVEYDRTKAIRKDDEGNLVTRSLVITPIQAANMFMFGEYGNSIQVPIYKFIQNVISGKGDPKVFQIEGKSYKINNQGEIETMNGKFNIIPSITYLARQILTPVQIYNQLITPMLSDKYIVDETKLFNRMVNDSQYSSMNMYARQKVTTNARAKLGKRVLGSYEYNYYDNSYIPKRVRQKIMRRLGTQRNIDEALR